MDLPLCRSDLYRGCVQGPYVSRAWEVELKLDECNGVSEQQDSQRMPSSGQHGLSPPTEHFYLTRVRPGHTPQQPVSGRGRRWGLLGSHQRALGLEFSSQIDLELGPPALGLLFQILSI